MRVYYYYYYYYYYYASLCCYMFFSSMSHAIVRYSSWGCFEFYLKHFISDVSVLCFLLTLQRTKLFHWLWRIVASKRVC